MDTIKRPEVILSMIAVGAAAGATTYGYRRLNVITDELSDVSGQLKNVINRVDNHESHRGMIDDLQIILDKVQDIVLEQSQAVDDIRKESLQQEEKNKQRDSAIQQLNHRLRNIEIKITPSSHHPSIKREEVPSQHEAAYPDYSPNHLHFPSEEVQWDVTPQMDTHDGLTQPDHPYPESPRRSRTFDSESPRRSWIFDSDYDYLQHPQSYEEPTSFHPSHTYVHPNQSEEYPRSQEYELTMPITNDAERKRGGNPRTTNVQRRVASDNGGNRTTSRDSSGGHGSILDRLRQQREARDPPEMVVQPSLI